MSSLTFEDGPCERMARASADALGDQELVAAVIGYRRLKSRAFEIATRVLAMAGGVHGLTRLSLEDLSGVPGIGREQACRVLAAVELGRRTLLTRPRVRPRILSSRDAAAVLLPRFGAHPVERFGVLLLDSRLRVIRAQITSVGSVDSSSAHPREVFREAVRARAAAVIAFHNHPSGDATPSPDDRELTRRLVAAGEIVGIQVVDHLVLADAQYCSLLQPGSD